MVSRFLLGVREACCFNEVILVGVGYGAVDGFRFFENQAVGRISGQKHWVLGPVQVEDGVGIRQVACTAKADRVL